MRLVRDQYLRLLAPIAAEPEQPLGKLVMRMQWDAAMAEVVAGAAQR
jgi:hypothetical protein